MWQWAITHKTRGPCHKSDLSALLRSWSQTVAVSCVSLMFWIADTFVSIAEQLNGRVMFPNHGVCFVVWKNISRNELISEIAACVLQIWWKWPLRPKQLNGIQPLFILIFTPGLFLLWHVKTSSVKFLLVDRVTGHCVLTRLESASLYVQSL